ncbi:MAG: hypothetical protein FH749_13235 [Firmicutes bacterium]|nr:hypothetical protein [Bacillota bacterium]
MKCCGGNDNQTVDEHHLEDDPNYAEQVKHKRQHSPLLMVLCCLIPLGLAFFFIQRGYSMGTLFVLLCPLLHVGMMWFMFRKGKEEAQHG